MSSHPPAVSPSVCVRRIVPAAAAIVLAFSSAAHGETYDWLPVDAGPLSWDAAANWTPGTLFPNAVSDVANVRSDLTDDQFIDLNQQITLGVLNIGDLNASHTFTIGAGTAGSFLFNNGAFAAEINQVATLALGLQTTTIVAGVATTGDLNIFSSGQAPLIFEAPITSAAATGTQAVTLLDGNIRFAGNLSDGGTGGKLAVVRSGAGTLSLLGDNSFTGGVTLNSGTLNLGSPTALGAASSVLTINGGNLDNTTGAAVSIANGNPQVWGGNFSAIGGSALNLGNGAVTLTGDRSVAVNNATLTVGGVIGDGGGGYSLTKTGAGMLSLTNANTYGGGTVVTGGRLEIRNASALGTNASVSVSGGGALQIQGGITISGKALALAGDGPGNGGALRSASGNNTWNGDINADTSAITRIGSDADLFTINGNIVTSGTAQFVLQGEGQGVINGVISGNAPLTRSVTGTGVWTLTGDNTYSGLTTISNGTLQIGNGGNSGTLGTAGVSIATIGTLAFNRGNDLTVSNAISGNGTFIKRGAGNITLTANSSFSGNTTIEAGLLTLGNESALRASTLHYNGQGGTLSFGTLTAASLGNLTGAQSIALTNTLAGAVTLTVGSNNQSHTYSGVLSGDGGLTKSGAGTLTLTATQTYAGTTTVNNGVLKIGDGGTSGALVAGSAVVTGGSGNLTFNRSDDFTLSHPISGTGTLTQAGPGNMTVTADLELTGTTAVTGGTLTLGSATALANSTLNYLGGQFSFGSATAPILGSLRGTKNLALVNANSEPVTLTVGQNANQTYSGSLSGGGALIKQSPGFLALTGDNTYTGTTTIAGGTLRVGDGGYGGSLVSNIVNDSVVHFSRANHSTYAGNISGTGTFTKLGSGTLTLTGAHSYEGATTVSSGTLLLDYSSSATVLPSGTPLTMGGGTLYVKGASSGNTQQVVGSLITSSLAAPRIVIDPNGGAGTTLTLGNSWTLNGSGGLHFDLSRGGTVLSSPGVTNGVIVGTGTVARVTVTGTDGRTYFGTVSGGAIVPQTTLTALTPTGSSSSTNFIVSGDLVATSTVNTATLRIDTTQTPGSLDLTGGNLNYSRTAILMDGSNNFEIKRSTGTGVVTNVVIHQYGTGDLTISAPYDVNGGFTKLGPGTLIGATDAAAGLGPASITIADGVYRIASVGAIPRNTTVIAGGILELAHGDYMATLGTSAGQVRLSSDGGFSAFGANRAVNLGGLSATMSWDNGNFLPNNSTFVLSSSKSDATLDFQNPIALGSLTRTVLVHDGSAAIDGQLSGAVGGVGNLVKTGAGTLALTATNTFTGTMTVNEGRLLVNGSLAGSVNVTRGILSGTGDGAITGLIAGGINVGDGVGTADAILSPGSSAGLLTTNGLLSLNSDAQFRFELDSAFQMSDLMSANGISIASGASFVAFELAPVGSVLPLNTTFIVLNNSSLEPISGVFANLANFAHITIGTNIFEANYAGGDGNDLVLSVVPEPASVGLLLAGLGAMIGMRPRRRKG